MLMPHTNVKPEMGRGPKQLQKEEEADIDEDVCFFIFFQINLITQKLSSIYRFINYLFICAANYQSQIWNFRSINRRSKLSSRPTTLNKVSTNLTPPGLTQLLSWSSSSAMSLWRKSFVTWIDLVRTSFRSSLLARSTQTITWPSLSAVWPTTLAVNLISSLSKSGNETRRCTRRSSKFHFLRSWRKIS